ncbi:hypothetical protein PVK06_003077 [Gossypium arboreum]|uniref:Thg1 C-terminal domain-containing protein n=1 Tax=Gossypium arboreum TaxID=29729 RepID=A0ABR0R5J4_GOSAR|nr:hypothetical protein PVK06_003077 [Gossypium arboreum]
MLGKSKSEAQNYLKGTQAREKNELLLKEFGINYNTLPAMFRLGSSVFRVKIASPPFGLYSKCSLHTLY